MIKITTIWWWNWQSSILNAFNTYFPDNFEIKSIVSMSDDGRTTGELIRNFRKEFDMHLPPPGDLRKCFYCSSKSKYLSIFKNIFEYIFSDDLIIKDYTIYDLFKLASKWLVNSLWKEIKSKYSTAPVKIESSLDKDIEWEIDELINNDSWKLYVYLNNKLWKYLDYKLPLSSSLKWHKFWNIIMASLYYNFWDYDKMVKIMHNFLEVKWKIIPVTVEKAFIKAILESWEVIETQDKISNDAEYTSRIVNFELMDNSKNAKHTKEVDNAIIDADFLIITPWDLYTSIISNFIIWWVKDSVRNSKAKIIMLWNNTNKWWETQWYKILDFIDQIEKYLWKKIDYFITNKEKIYLSWIELENFKTNISVQWGDFLYLTDEEKQILEKKWTTIIEWDLIDKEVFYKHNKKIISELLINLILSIKN